MKILIVDNVNFIDYPTGGILSFYRSMLPAFGDDISLAGITTDTTTPVGTWTKKEINGTVYDYYSIKRVKPRAEKPLVPERIKYLFRMKRHVKKILSYQNYDIILTHNVIAVRCFPKEALKKTCLIMPGLGNSMLISRYKWAHGLAKFYDRYFLTDKPSRCKYILAAADRNACADFAARSQGRIKADDIITFPTRYDDQFFHQMNQQECRLKVGLNLTDTVFVTVGRLGWFKGWKFMIDSFILAMKEKPDSKLLFIGDGEDQEKMEQYINERGLQGKVLLCGKKSPKEIGIYLNAADVFIMGSYTEGWSTTLVEACACRMPCVVTNFSSAKEMIENDVNGYIIEERDEALFSSMMLKALSMDRDKISEYNNKFDTLALSNLKSDFLRVVNN